MRDDLAEHVVPDMTDVELARRVGEHLEDVGLPPELLAGRRVVYVERAAFGPDALPLRLDCLWVIALHRTLQKRKSLSGERPWEAGAAGPRCLPGLLEKPSHSVSHCSNSPLQSQAICTSPGLTSRGGRGRRRSSIPGLRGSESGGAPNDRRVCPWGGGAVGVVAASGRLPVSWIQGS